MCRSSGRGREGGRRGRRAGGARLGINLMAWSGGVGRAELALLPRLAALGFDGVELPLLAPERVATSEVHAAAADAGLALTASAALPSRASLLDASRRARAVNWIENCLACAASCGASLLCGPLCAPVGQTPGRPATADEWRSCVLGLKEVGARAADRGIVVALELLNRFETHFLNTVEDGLRLVQEVDNRSVGLHLDTFHANIEERDPIEAITRCGRWLAHVHFSENDRGTLGTGHIDFVGAADALRAAGYLDRPTWIVAETFAGSVPEIAAATAIWRPIVPDPWQYAADSLALMRRVL